MFTKILKLQTLLTGDGGIRTWKAVSKLSTLGFGTEFNNTITELWHCGAMSWSAINSHFKVFYVTDISIYHKPGSVELASCAKMIPGQLSLLPNSKLAL